MGRRSDRRAEILRWVFLVPRADRRLAGIGRGLVLLVAVAVANTTCQQYGIYDRLDLADLDRLQQAAPATAPGNVSLVLIDEQEYADLFAATSPLDARRLTDLVAAVCRFAPRAVGIDILTGDGVDHPAPGDPRLAGCPTIWIRDIPGVAPPSQGATTPPLKLGRVLGSDSPPAGTCTVISVLVPDADGVIRRYPRDHPAVRIGSNYAEAWPTLVAALASYARGDGCPRPRPAGAAAPATHRIRFSSNDRFPDPSAALVLEAAAAPGSALDAGLRALLEDRLVIIGGTYRHARDTHRTPIGAIPGSRILANAVYTDLEAPIANVPWWQALAIDIAVGALLLIGITWAGLRWPWAALASLLLTGIAALMISWTLHSYLGYFLGVMAGLMGVVLAVFAEVLWEPMRDMWRAWIAQYPRVPAMVAAPVQARAPMSQTNQVETLEEDTVRAPDGAES